MSTSREEAQQAAKRAKAKAQQQAKPNGEATPAPIFRADTIGGRAVSWLWYPRLPSSQISILGAPGGGGKGLNAAHYTACITTGRPWPDGATPDVPGHVLWCETEDPLPEVVVPRLIAAGADRSKVEIASRQAFADLGDGLKDFIRSRGTRLVVMSPFISFLKLADINSELGVRDVLEQLQASIDGTGCAILGLCHINKKGDLRAIERLLGSVAFANFVRCVLLVGRDKDEPDWFRLVHGKHNLSIKADDLLYKPVHVGEDPRDQFVKLDWRLPDGNIDADGLFDRSRSNGSAKPTAGQWLAAYLREHGETLRADIILDAEEAGFKESAIRAAQTRDPKIQSRQVGFQGPAYWSLT